MKIDIQFVEGEEEYATARESLIYKISEQCIEYMKENKKDFTEAFDLLTDCMNAGINRGKSVIQKIAKEKKPEDPKALGDLIQSFGLNGCKEFLLKQDKTIVLWTNEAISAYRKGYKIAVETCMDEAIQFGKKQKIENAEKESKKENG